MIYLFTAGAFIFWGLCSLICGNSGKQTPKQEKKPQGSGDLFTDPAFLAGYIGGMMNKDK